MCQDHIIDIINRNTIFYVWKLVVSKIYIDLVIPLIYISI